MIDDGGITEPLVARLLASVRERLAMDVALVARAVGGEHEVAAAQGDAAAVGVAPGSLKALPDMYCSLVVDSGQAVVLPDTAADARSAALAKANTNVRSYVGVPLASPTGEIYGTLCCIGRETRPEVDGRDVAYMTVVADVVVEHLGALEAVRQARRQATDLISAVLADPAAVAPVFQPIVRLADDAVSGVEALSRFAPLAGAARPPNVWFAEAASVGMGVDLEIDVIDRALAAASGLASARYISVNTSPATVSTQDLYARAERFGGRRLVVEVTEHDVVEAYDELLVPLYRLRQLGARVAVDDAGSGYASLRHILRLRPDIIKLDIDLVRGIDADPGRRSLAAALVGFAADMGAVLVAEGIETDDERQALRDLGVAFGQGYLLGRPSPDLPA